MARLYWTQVMIMVLLICSCSNEKIDLHQVKEYTWYDLDFDGKANYSVNEDEGLNEVFIECLDDYFILYEIFGGGQSINTFKVLERTSDNSWKVLNIKDSKLANLEIHNSAILMIEREYWDGDSQKFIYSKNPIDKKSTVRKVLSDLDQYKNDLSLRRANLVKRILINHEVGLYRKYGSSFYKEYLPKIDSIVAK